MAKPRNLHKFFLIDLFVKGACYVVKILHKYKEFCRNNGLLFSLYLSRKALFLQNYLKYITEIQCQGTDTFGFIQLFKFKFKGIFFINSA